MLEALYTTASGPGASADQPYPSSSLGGFASRTEWNGGVVGDLYGRASSADAVSNRKDYRALYLYNPDPTALTALRLFVTPVTVGGDISLGVDPRPITHVDSLSPQAVDITTAYTIPTGVAFTAPTDYATGIVVGDLPGETVTVAGAGRTVWLRRTPSYVPGINAEACDVTAQSAAGVIWTRRIYWQVEPVPSPALSPSAPLYPQRFVPTPSPFLRTTADFVSDTGARITWELDATLRDVGPYVFQLQSSPSGGPNSSDWIDVGPPSRDTFFLTDSGVRLWGMSATLFYRVVLTTAVATYTSPPANVYGALGCRDWLDVREILRKERMYQRELVGTDGFLLKAKRYGTRCVCVNQFTGEINNSSCPICFSVGIVGGYHEPIPATYATVAPKSGNERVAYNENLGTVRPVTVQGRVVADVPILSRDAWSSVGGDFRYYVHTVTEAAAWMGVPVIYQIELREAPRSDVIYEFPLERPDNFVPDWRTPTSITV